MLKQKYIVAEPTRAEANFRFFMDRLVLQANQQNWEKAQAAAGEWADWVCRDLKMPQKNVWKEFKRGLAAKWFGSPERRIFSPEWSVQEAMEYARQLPGRNLRVSCFPKDIACHAESHRLPAGQEVLWLKILSAIDRALLIEIFPESSTPESICFRRLASAFGEEIIYEAGKGQAMAVFEDEQGMHPMVFAQKMGETKYILRYAAAPIGNADSIAEISKKLRLLIRRHDQNMQIKCFNLCRKTGIERLGVEGYFNPQSKSELTIVDIDLPFDFVFMR